jgi:hypothetical protein
MKPFLILLLPALLLFQCSKNPESNTDNQAFIMKSSVQQVIDSLILKHGEAQKDRVTNGVKQVAEFWRATDGTAAEFEAYCRENFISDKEQLDKVFQRISTNMEVIIGYFNKISVDLQRPLQLDMGEILQVDESFGSYSPATHFKDDFFNNKIAFLVVLNFPHYTLEEKTRLSASWSRKDWAYARLGDVFDSRVPSEVNQLVVNAITKSEMYIADYNIFAGKLVNDAGQTLFPPEMKLLSHWNIRDEIKANYGKADGLEKQRMLYEVMNRIVTQEIPMQVINSSAYNWNPFTNKVFENGKEMAATPESSDRYAMILDFFHAQQKVDVYYPALHTYLLRNFEKDMEVPLADIENLFTTYLSSPQILKLADLIKKRLGRDLEPFDVWYDGFKTRTSIPAETLDKATRKKYPNPEAVQDDLPLILMKLGFTREKALAIASEVQVDPARGSGHAWGAETREQKSLLRTRIFTDGMDYKGYNIAIHEFGHNVEQTISLHNVDYYMLRGVPNTAFTETLAFLFQKNDLALLGIKNNSGLQEYYNGLDNAWGLYEIMGVSLVDVNTWKWLYANPGATPETLKDAVNSIAKDIWNQYFAPVIGIRDQPILAVYSHMVNSPLYLPNYAYGHIIEFQLTDYLKGRNFAGEVERMYSLGRLTPQQWMQEAVGGKISVEPILKTVDEALLKTK